jgi:hypothetical protein
MKEFVVEPLRGKGIASDQRKATGILLKVFLKSR